MLSIINTMILSLLGRRYELAVMRSVGMTNRQARKMLIVESLYYGVISVAALLSIGTAINRAVFDSFKEEAEYAIFDFPVFSLIAITAMIMAFFIIVPIIVYNSVFKRNSVSLLLRRE